MTDFTVTLSEMSSASNEFKAQAQVFNETADKLLLQAANLTTSGWDDDASKVFLLKMADLRAWCKEMATIIETYATGLTNIGGRYEESDQFAASQF